MLVRVTTTIILLALFTHCIEEFERVVVVTESDVATDDSFINGDGENITTSAMGSGNCSNTMKSLCCIFGNCSCTSLYNALANLSNNVLINITTDVELFVAIQIVGLSNIAITGHNNPTVNCNGSGRLHFISCYNCTIEGITWEGCGTRNISFNDEIYPVFQLTNSYNLTIQNCSFQHSIGPAVVLSGMSGDVNINYCNFLYNNEYEGHGTAIHYSSNNTLRDPSIKFIITGCNYFYNGRAKSVVYFSKLSTNFEVCEYLELQDSKFIHNKGVPIYLSYQDLYINRNVEFSDNVAEDGGGVFISDHSNVIFHKSATVNFTNNRATNNGGAIFLTNHSSILFRDHFTSYQCINEQYNTLGDQLLANFIMVTFYHNTANQLGQDIYAHTSNMVVGNHAMIALYGNGWDYPHISSAVYAEPFF